MSVNHKDKNDNTERHLDDDTKNKPEPKKLNELELLYSFMRKYKNESKKHTGIKLPWTHSMLYEPYGAYNIPEDLYNKFRKIYENAIVAGYKPHITEKHKEFGPIVIDFDFVQAKEHNKRCYTQITIENIIKLYNSVIKKYLDVPSNKMPAYVMEKDSPTLRKGEYHDGIHIVYPYICTKPSLQMVMREDFLKLAEEHRIFKKIPLVNSLDSVFDKSVIYHTGWMMYGSRKDTSSSVYHVSHIYHCSHSVNDEIIFDTIIPGENLHKRDYTKHFIDVLSCRRYHTDAHMTPLAEWVDLEEVDNKINKIREKIIKTDAHVENVGEMMGEEINFIKAVNEELLSEAKNLVRLFKKERATDYHSWYQVGKCLHNVDYRLLPDWIQFSKKCADKFKPGECERLWKKMKSSNYTMATLHYFASKDNPQKYLELKKERLNTLLKNGLEASHCTIANLVMEKYKYRFRCASITNNLWYQFKNHRWEAVDSACALKNLISREVTQDYSNQRNYLLNVYAQADEGKKEAILKEIEKVGKVIRQLNNRPFKDNIVKDCADISREDNVNFLKYLDENTNLLCFENGVYDLESDTFRDGCPDDYISLCTGYNYMKLDKNDATYKEIMEFMKKIQPDKEMREYLLTLISTCLAGSISEESFYVLTGSGSNGKSKFMELLKHTLGELFKPMDIRLLTEKRSSSSSASPEVADKKGIRACPLDEPKATDEINTGFMKIFTGGDVITARALFKEPIYFKPQFKPFLLCNNLPNIKSDDDGTWRRLKVIPFSSKFKKLSEATKKERKHGLPPGQFWADMKLSDKLPEWKETFMGILIEYYQKYKKEGLIHPKLVTEHTAAYRKRCDVYQDFIGDYLEKSNNPKDTITILHLHEGMRSWYRANYDGKCPNTKDLRAYIQQRMPTYVGKTDSLTCYKIKTNDNEDTMDELANICVDIQ